MFYRCAHCNELRAPTYSYCPGCYAATDGCVPSSSPASGDLTLSDAPQRHTAASNAPRRFKFRPDVLTLLFFTGLFFISRHPQALDDLAKKATIHSVNDEKIAQLCELDQQAQSDNTYPSELRYLDSWIAAIADGNVHHASSSREVNTMDVTVPKNLSAEKAHWRASFYRVMFVSMRKQYLPQSKASECSVTIYDRFGRSVAIARNNSMQD